MYRKVISVVFVLGLMTLVVSAQQPATNRQQGDTDRPTLVLPLAQDSQPSSSAPSIGQPMYPFSNYQKERAQAFGFGRQGDELVKQYARAKGDEKDKIQAKIVEALEKQFDARQKHHQEELAALEAQVNKLKELVQKRQENRRDIITRRFDQLVRDAQGLGW
jgi:polyhydroxyalkanoate synthesis regulator phasin